MVGRRLTAAIQVLRDYTKDLDKIKVSKAAMDGTIRNPAAMAEEMRAPGQSESKPRDLSPGDPQDNLWNRKNEAEMIEGQNEMFEGQGVTSINRR